MRLSARVTRRATEIEHQIPHLETRCARFGALAARQRFDAREEFDEVIGLGEVVIATRPQTAHAVVHLVKRAQDQHGGRNLMLPERANKREPVEPRQHAIDDENVEPFMARAVQAIEPVRHLLDGIAAFAQCVRKIVACLVIILDDKNAHETGNSNDS